MQLDMEKAFGGYGFSYERKVRQYAGLDIEPASLITNEAVAQWHLAVVLKLPSDARGRKYKVWGEHYSRIFSGGPVQPYLVAPLLGRQVQSWLRERDLMHSETDIERMLAKRGAFHLARMACHLWRGGPQWAKDVGEAEEALQALITDPGMVDGHIEEAFSRLARILQAEEAYAEDIDRALKSYGLDERIDKNLYAKG